MSLLCGLTAWAGKRLLSKSSVVPASASAPLTEPMVSPSSSSTASSASTAAPISTTPLDPSAAPVTSSSGILTTPSINPSAYLVIGSTATPALPTRISSNTRAFTDVLELICDGLHGSLALRTLANLQQCSTLCHKIATPYLYETIYVSRSGNSLLSSVLKISFEEGRLNPSFKSSSRFHLDFFPGQHLPSSLWFALHPFVFPPIIHPEFVDYALHKSHKVVRMWSHLHFVRNLVMDAEPAITCDLAIIHHLVGQLLLPNLQSISITSRLVEALQHLPRTNWTADKFEHIPVPVSHLIHICRPVNLCIEFPLRAVLGPRRAPNQYAPLANRNVQQWVRHWTGPFTTLQTVCFHNAHLQVLPLIRNIHNRVSYANYAGMSFTQVKALKLYSPGQVAAVSKGERQRKTQIRRAIQDSILYAHLFRPSDKLGVTSWEFAHVDGFMPQKHGGVPTAEWIEAEVKKQLNGWKNLRYIDLEPQVQYLDEDTSVAPCQACRGTGTVIPFDPKPDVESSNHVAEKR